MRQGLMSAVMVGALTLGTAGLVLGATGEVLPTDGDSVSGDGIVYTACNEGILEECGTRSTKTCTEWKTSYGVGIGISGSIGLTPTVNCVQWVETTMKLYRNKPAPKQA